MLPADAGPTITEFAVLIGVLTVKFALPNITVLATPPTPTNILPPDVEAFILLVPLAIDVPLGVAPNTPLPYNTVEAFPFKLTVAILPIPDTLATATAFAVVA